MASRKHAHASRNAVPLNTVDDTYTYIKNVRSKYSLQRCDHNLIIFCTRTYFMIKRVSYRFTVNKESHGCSIVNA